MSDLPDLYNDSGKGKRRAEPSRSQNFRWNKPQTACLMEFLSELVRSGKRCNRNAAAAKYISQVFDVNVEENNVKNTLRTWKQKWQRILRLKNLSGVSWDEDTKTVIMGVDEAKAYILAHSEVEPFINRPILFYDELETIFGVDVATGRYSMGDRDSIDGGEQMGLEDDIFGAGDGEGFLNHEAQRGTHVSPTGTKRSKGSSYMSVSYKGNPSAGPSRRLPTADEAYNMFAGALQGICGVMMTRQDEEMEVMASIQAELEELVGSQYGGYTFTAEHTSFAYDYLVDKAAKARGFHTRSVESRRI